METTCNHGTYASTTLPSVLFLIPNERVHTQFWADLQGKVNLSKIEDDVWAKMSAEAEEAKNHASAPNFMPSRLTTPLAHDLDVVTKPASVEQQKKKSRTGQSRSSSARNKQGQHVRDDGDSDTSIGHAPEDDSSNLRVLSSEKFLCVPGYDEVGHVPTLEEFRQEWPRSTSSSFKNQQQLESVGAGGSSKAGRRGQGQTQGNRGQSQGQGAIVGSVVQDLSKKDEAFRHFKKFYDKTGQAGVGLNSNGTMVLLSATEGGSAMGILRPDLSVIEAVGRHTAETEEVRCQMKIGQGISSTSADGLCRKSRSGSGRGSKSGRSALRDDGNVGSEDKRNGDGLINVFRKSVKANEDTARRAAQSAVNAFSLRNKDDETATPSEVSGARNGGESCRGDGGSGGTRTARSCGPRSSSVRDSTTESRLSSKGSVEGSSTAAELQVRGCRLIGVCHALHFYLREPRLPIAFLLASSSGCTQAAVLCCVCFVRFSFSMFTVRQDDREACVCLVMSLVHHPHNVGVRQVRTASFTGLVEWDLSMMKDPLNAHA